MDKRRMRHTDWVKSLQLGVHSILCWGTLNLAGGPARQLYSCLLDTICCYHKVKSLFSFSLFLSFSLSLSHSLNLSTLIYCHLSLWQLFFEIFHLIMDCTHSFFPNPEFFFKILSLFKIKFMNCLYYVLYGAPCREEWCFLIVKQFLEFKK